MIEDDGLGFILPKGYKSKSDPFNPTKKKTRTRNMAPKSNGFKNEDEFQIWAMRFARTLFPGYPIWHTPNEGKVGRVQQENGRKFNRTGQIRKAKGVLSGVCDFIDAANLLAVELKMPGNKPTENQEKFMLAMQNNPAGWTVGVARTKEDFVQLYYMATKIPTAKLWQYYGMRRPIVPVEDLGIG